MKYVRETQKLVCNLQSEFVFQCLLFTNCYVLSTAKVQLTVELVKCTLLLDRLPILQIYCVLLVLIMWWLDGDCEFGTGYVLSTVKVQLTAELVKCTLLLDRLPVIQLHESWWFFRWWCCYYVLQNNMQALCLKCKHMSFIYISLIFLPTSHKFSL
jgi:hypothetical protein